MPIQFTGWMLLKDKKYHAEVLRDGDFETFCGMSASLRGLRRVSVYGVLDPNFIPCKECYPNAVQHRKRIETIVSAIEDWE